MYCRSLKWLRCLTLPATAPPAYGGDGCGRSRCSSSCPRLTVALSPVSTRCASPLPLLDVLLSSMIYVGIAESCTIYLDFFVNSLDSVSLCFFSFLSSHPCASNFHDTRWYRRNFHDVSWCFRKQSRSRVFRFFFFPLIPSIYSLSSPFFLLLLPYLRTMVFVSQTRGHIAGMLFSPAAPHDGFFVSCMAFPRENLGTFFLPSWNFSVGGTGCRFLCLLFVGNLHHVRGCLLLWRRASRILVVFWCWCVLSRSNSSLDRVNRVCALLFASLYFGESSHFWWLMFDVCWCR